MRDELSPYAILCLTDNRQIRGTQAAGITLMKNKYIPESGAIVEMICSLAAILLLFTTWLTGYANGETLDKFPTTINLFAESSDTRMLIIKVVIVLFFVNIIVKFFDRTAWLSAVCALINGYFVLFVNKLVFDFNNDVLLKLADGQVYLSTMGIIATLVEIAFVIALFVRFVSWVIELFNKRGGKPFVVSMVALAVLFLALTGMFVVMLQHKGNCSDNPTYVGWLMLGMASSVTFCLFDIIGIVKWFQLKRQDKIAPLATITQDDTVNEVPEGQEHTDAEQKKEPGRITLRQILLFATLGILFTPSPFFLDLSMKEDKTPSIAIDATEPEAVYQEKSSVQPDEESGFYEEETSTAEQEAGDYSADSYVTVTGVNVRLRTSPEINDFNIIKDNRGKNLHPNKGERLRVVGEEDEFYLVDYHGHNVYISKQFAVPD